MLSGLKRGEMHIGGRSGSIEKKDCATKEEIPREKKEGEGLFFSFSGLGVFFLCWTTGALQAGHYFHQAAT